MDSAPLRILAPAKLNLCLHVLGRRADGYHELDSLVAFADVGDYIEVRPAPSFSFTVDGPFANALSAAECDDSAQGTNLAVIAARRLAQLLNMPLQLELRLTKNLPLAAGIGGGSADAAATVWALLQFWQRGLERERLVRFLSEIGSDVPVCYDCIPQRMQGVGEQLSAAPELPELPLVLFNPGVPCPTQHVFKAWHPPGSGVLRLPDDLSNRENLLGFMRQTANDLEEACMSLHPLISQMRADITEQKDCLLARLSGSGPTMFGLFETMEAAAEAVIRLKRQWPDGCICAGWLNRARRY